MLEMYHRSSNVSPVQRWVVISSVAQFYHTAGHITIAAILHYVAKETDFSLSKKVTFILINGITRTSNDNLECGNRDVLK